MAPLASQSDPCPLPAEPLEQIAYLLRIAELRRGLVQIRAEMDAEHGLFSTEQIMTVHHLCQALDRCLIRLAVRIHTHGDVAVLAQQLGHPFVAEGQP